MNTNELASGPPDDHEPLAELFGEVSDLAARIVEDLTNDQIIERRRQVLASAGFVDTEPASTQSVSDQSVQSDDVTPGEHAADPSYRAHTIYLDRLTDLLRAELRASPSAMAVEYRKGPVEAVGELVDASISGTRPGGYAEPRARRTINAWLDDVGKLRPSQLIAVLGEIPEDVRAAIDSVRTSFTAPIRQPSGDRPHSRLVPDITYRILGPIGIIHGEDWIPVPPGRQQVILGILLLNANRVVSTDQLIDAVWGEQSPTTARSQIQICVFQLRQLFHRLGMESPIETRSPGYLLHVGGGQLDLDVFADLVSQADVAAEDGRFAEAADLLRRALSLWHGPALGGASSPAFTSKAVRLAEDRLNALEWRIDLELRLGQHRQVVGELGDLVQEHPLREGLRRLYMLALYRSGRAAEALEVYRVGRQLLVDELGMEPSEDLRRLERAILNEDDSLRLRGPEPISVHSTHPSAPRAPETLPVGPSQLPADTTDFTGRDSLVAEVEAALQAASDVDSPVPVVAITGVHGIGKTALAVYVAHRLSSNLFPDGQLFCDFSRMQLTPVAINDILTRFLRAFGVPSSTIPDELDKRADMYRNVLGNKRVLIVLDDVTSPHQVIPLLPANCRSCAVVVTSRSRLAGIPGSQVFDVGVFRAEEALQMLRNVIGEQRVAAEPAAADALIRMVGRLPLALRVVAARLVARPHWTLASMLDRLSDERRRLDELAYGDLMVRASLTLVYDGLPPRAARLFRLLSDVAGESLPIWVAGALLDDGPMESAELLELLVDAKLLEIVSLNVDGHPRYGFHNLIWLFARDQLRTSDDARIRPAALTRVLGGWLALVETAHRAVYGGDFAVIRGTAPRWQPPTMVRGQVLADPLGWLEAERSNLCSAVSHAADAGLHEQAWELAVALVTLFESFSYFDDWQKTHERALEAVRRAGNRRGEAALLCSLGSLHISRRRLAVALSVLEPALDLFAELGDDYGVAMTHRNLALLYDNQGHPETAAQAYDRALDGFRHAGDLGNQAYVLTQIAQLDLVKGHTETAIDRLQEALQICREITSPRIETQVMYRLGQVLVHQQQYEWAEQIMINVLDMTRRNHDALGESYALHSLGAVVSALGRPVEGQQLMRSALEIKDRILDTTGMAKVYLDLVPLLAEQGNVAQAIELTERALTVFTERRMSAWMDKAEALLNALASSINVSTHR